MSAPYFGLILIIDLWLKVFIKYPKMNRTDMLVTTPLLDSKNSLADWFAIATFIESPVLLLMLCWCIHTGSSREMCINLMRSAGVSTQYQAEQCRCLCGPQSCHYIHCTTTAPSSTPSTPPPRPQLFTLHRIRS